MKWQQILMEFPGELLSRGECNRDNLIVREIGDQVGAALASLPLRYREALVLREVEEWSYEEIAVALGCRIGTVKSRICRGREQLRQLLSPYWTGGLHHEPRSAA